MTKKRNLENRVEIQDKAIWVSLYANALAKGMNPSLFSPAMGKIEELTRFFSLDKTTGWERNTKFKPVG